MNTIANIMVVTVGKILGELKKYEKERWDNSIVAWMSDDHTLGVVGMGKDKNGDLRIEVEEVKEELEGIWTVADVIESLELSGKETRAYMAGHGLYFAIDSDGGIFTEADDDDIIGCYVTAFGEYEEESSSVGKSQVARRSTWKAQMNNWRGILEGVTFLLCILLAAYGLYYNIAALVKHSRPVWESVLWIPFLALLLTVCIDNFFFSGHNE